MPSLADRRRFEHLTLPKPLPARFGSEKVFILDLSINGARVAHQHPQLATSSEFLRFEWQGAELAFESEVLRTSADSTKIGSTTVWESGLFFLEAVGGSDRTIRELLADQILRVLDERKANARGIPPIAATYVKTGGREGGYVIWRLAGGQWRSTASEKADQPADGFTVSARESSDQVQMLRETYENSDFEGRKMIRKMAELATSTPEGVATRKFQP
ncbi:MAG: PilZ domain-containing protein [Acidobacteria bacterium]|nr:PilZ domain-containing protein [Acidobacteriota bacterium]